MTVSDDGEGNVVFENSILINDSRIITIEEDVEAIKATLEKGNNNGS